MSPVSPPTQLTPAPAFSHCEPHIEHSQNIAIARIATRSEPYTDSTLSKREPPLGPYHEMAEAAFFYNSTCMREVPPKPPKPPPKEPKSPKSKSPKSPSAHERARLSSKAASQRPTPNPNPLNTHHKRLTSSSKDSDTSSSFSNTTRRHTIGPPSLDAANFERDEEYDRMLSTPLVDYKHAANQSTKARAAAAAAAQRKSSSTGTSSERKHALQSKEAAARGDTPGRSSSISSATGSSALTAVTSNEYSSSIGQTGSAQTRPFARRNGRRVLRDVAYPLPVDLTEIHRQTLRTMLLCQVFNGPVCSPAFDKKPPKRVLDVGCGTGFWSVMCHRHFSQRGFTSISFTGVDIAPLAPAVQADEDMNWRFVQYDMLKTPSPFRDNEFNLIMSKDMSLAHADVEESQGVMEEYLRILKPGGTLEIWDGDHSIRMLLPHTASATEDEHANAMGTYTLTPQTPMAAPQNQYIQDYNTWIVKALNLRKLTDMPCTLARASMLQEPELTEIHSRRLAIPLGEVRWEREGVGVQGKGKAKESEARKQLTAGQAALRRTALDTFVQFIESMEPVLRDVSGKGQDEWDRWYGNMMNDLLKNNGTSWGECLEVGAWWAKKVKLPA